MPSRKKPNPVTQAAIDSARAAAYADGYRDGVTETIATLTRSRAITTVAGARTAERIRRTYASAAQSDMVQRPDPEAQR